MTAFQFAARPLAIAALLCAAGASHAEITVNTNFASFVAATGGSTDSFSDLTINTVLEASIYRTAAPYGYTVSAPTNLFVIPAAGTIGLSAGVPTDSITISGFVTPVRAVGANFYGSNVLGESASGALTVVATDINGLVSTQAVAGNSLTNGFVGFLSDAPLASLVVSLTVANVERYVSVDNVVLSAVPEASTWLMMLAGGAALLRISARRRG